MSHQPSRDLGPGAGVVFTPAGLARRLAGAAGVPRGPVLDPACGDGALLLAVLEARGASRSQTAANLFGIELDPELARRCRERILAAVAPGDDELARTLERNIRCADALDPRVPWPGGARVISNPPWVLSLIHI